jgi:Protein of unknown function (DUF1097)
MPKGYQMNSNTAYTVSIGGLAALDTYLTATLIPVPVWVTFIAWASFFILGAGSTGLVRSAASNLTGVLIGSATLVVASSTSGTALLVAILVGIGSAAMVQASRISLLSTLPAIVWGFASTVGTTVATGKPITTPGFANPALVAAAALVLGGLFGYVSEWLAALLTSKSAALADKHPA